MSYKLISRVRQRVGRLYKSLRGGALTRLRNILRVVRASRLISKEQQVVVFITSLLRGREIKMATALRRAGWKVILIYIETTPFQPGDHFDEVIKARTEAEAHAYAKALGPRICHVFTGAVDGMIYRFCADKPGPVVIDMNDIFCPSLFDYCHERFEPTRECLERAEGLCARDLQGKSAERLDGFQLPRHVMLFPEYSSGALSVSAGAPKKDPDEVRIVSVGTICLEALGMYDSGYLKLAEMLTAQKIHLHIYPHWFYRKSAGSAFNFDLKKDFVDFFKLQEKTPYLHVHESLPLDELFRVLPQYDFGIVSGGSPDLGQELRMLKPEYMRTCYSGRIADYLDARLPVLINREVGFNFWLLKRYGVGVDLGGVLQPGFRERLLELKRDPSVGNAVDRAARRLAVDGNIGRLTRFYEDIIDDAKRYRVRLGYPMSLVKSIPVAGTTFRNLETAILRVNQTAENLRQRLETEQTESRHQQQLLKEQGLLINDLRKRLDKSELQSESQSEVLAEFKRKPPVSPAGRRERRSITHAKQSLEVERGSRWADELSGLLNWPEIKDPAEQATGMPELLEMMYLFASSTGALSSLSSCWQVLGFKNFNQLLRDGYRNFKRTVGLSYFNFLIQAGDPQLEFLEANVGAAEKKWLKSAASEIPDDPLFEWHDQKSYRYFVLLLWHYARERDTRKHLNVLKEPREGNPLLVPYGQEHASQDLANSLLEYYAISEGVDFEKCRKVVEIGGGYGRNAFVTLTLNPHIQYTMVDIPPALWIAQRYLSSVFSERKIFPVRDFQSYEEVAGELEAASVVFLLPHQLALMPDKRFDLGINISSFGEMRAEQIKTYLDLLDRVVRGHFYMKQWKISQNAFDHLQLTEDNYPVSRRWTRVYSRTCAVQTAFFENLYRTEP
jgi:putative sugar O-methyltransferase